MVTKDNFESIISNFNIENMAQYLRNFAPLEYFPKGHPIDYHSLQLLDYIKSYISDSNVNPLLLMNDVADYNKLAWILFCISLKNIHSDKFCIGYAFLAYVYANKGIECQLNKKLENQFVRLRITGFMENDFYNIFQKMHNNEEISLLADDALAMAIMSDVYNTKAIKCQEKWFTELRESVREHEPDYEYLTEADIIKTGCLVHKALTSCLINKKVKLFFYY
ncbi:MAG: hypothetical protein K2K98_01605 [Muribaculaceae bacterium]|nr:hypothetical protein [Muribaculaceae bacterium]